MSVVGAQGHILFNFFYFLGVSDSMASSRQIWSAQGVRLLSFGNLGRADDFAVFFEAGRRALQQRFAESVRGQQAGRPGLGSERASALAAVSFAQAWQEDFAVFLKRSMEQRAWSIEKKEELFNRPFAEPHLTTKADGQR